MLFVSVCVQPDPEKDPLALHPRVFAMTGGRRTEGNKNIRGVRLRTTGGGRGLEIQGIYEGLLNWRQSFLGGIRINRHPL
jgi:hypothetical protein